MYRRGSFLSCRCSLTASLLFCSSIVVFYESQRKPSVPLSLLRLSWTVKRAEIPQRTPKHKDSSFSLINDKEKQQTLMLKKLEPGSVWHFSLEKWLKTGQNSWWSDGSALLEGKEKLVMVIKSTFHSNPKYEETFRCFLCSLSKYQEKV